MARTIHFFISKWIIYFAVLPSSQEIKEKKGYLIPIRSVGVYFLCYFFLFPLQKTTRGNYKTFRIFLIYQNSASLCLFCFRHSLWQVCRCSFSQHLHSLSFHVKTCRYTLLNKIAYVPRKCEFKTVNFPFLTKTISAGSTDCSQSAGNDTCYRRREASHLQSQFYISLGETWS